MPKTRYQHRIAFRLPEGGSIQRPIELIGGTIQSNRIKLKKIARMMKENGGFKSYKIMY